MSMVATKIALIPDPEADVFQLFREVLAVKIVS